MSQHCNNLFSSNLPFPTTDCCCLSVRRLPAQWGGSIGYSGGFVHTIENYIPYAQYNLSHPEWYGGARQPCCKYSNTGD